LLGYVDVFYNQRSRPLDAQPDQSGGIEKRGSGTAPSTESDHNETEITDERAVMHGVSRQWTSR